MQTEHDEREIAIVKNKYCEALTLGMRKNAVNRGKERAVFN